MIEIPPENQIFLVKADFVSGTSYKEIHKNAQTIFYQIKCRTKRKPYIRSAFFKKEKVFFEYFWIHLYQKNRGLRFQRLKYFSAAIELMKKSRNKPEIVLNPTNKNEKLYRFFGKVKTGEIFIVQIKENLSSGNKYFMSVFPK